MLEGKLKGFGYYSKKFDEIFSVPSPVKKSNDEAITELMNQSDSINTYGHFLPYIGFYTSDIFGLDVKDVQKIGNFGIAGYCEDRFVDGLKDKDEALDYLISKIKGENVETNLNSEELSGLNAILNLYNEWGLMDKEEFRNAIITIHENQKKRYLSKNISGFAKAGEAIGEQSGYLVYLFLENQIPDKLKPKVEYFTRRMGSIGNLLDDILDSKSDEEFFGIKMGLKAKALDAMIMLKHGFKMATKINWYVISEFLIASITGVYKLKKK